MTMEVIDQPTSARLPEAGSLQMFLRAILEGHDGLYMDNEPERARLASALAAALLTAGGEGLVNQPVLPVDQAPPGSLPQITGSSASTPLPE
jgi:hypothetical protein